MDYWYSSRDFVMEMSDRAVAGGSSKIVIQSEQRA
jgi:hypothetical protein